MPMLSRCRAFTHVSSHDPYNYPWDPHAKRKRLRLRGHRGLGKVTWLVQGQARSELRFICNVCPLFINPVVGMRLPFAAC